MAEPTSYKYGVKERAFVRHYLTGKVGVRGNAGKSYKAAGYTARTMNTAYVEGHKLLRKPKIQSLVAEFLERADVKAERVLREMARLAFADMRDFASWGPEGVSLRDSDELSDDAAAAVSEVKETRTTRTTKDDETVETSTLTFKLHPKTENIRMLATHFGLLRETVDVFDWAALLEQATTSELEELSSAKDDAKVVSLLERMEKKRKAAG